MSMVGDRWSAASIPADLAELHAILECQRRDFVDKGPPSFAVRRERLDRLILLLTANAQVLADAIHADFGNRPAEASLFTDIAGILPDLLMTRNRLRRWMRDDTVRGSGLLGLPTVIEKRPLGVVGVIGPWNFPVGLVVQPAAAALAAGNRVMIKFSEVTPRTADAFSAAAARYFPREELAVVTGGPEVGAQFSSLPLDHLFFTGSSHVGAQIARAAGANLVPVTLELGGKNPAVVAPGSDVNKSAERIMAARMANGGQICLCPDYVFVPTASVDAFVAAAVRTADTIASPANAAGLVSAVNDRNFDRVTSLIDDARQRGARVVTAALGHDRTQRRLTPTLLQDVTDDMQISQEEVFGPVLSVLPYDDIATVVDHVNRGHAPLAAYWFGPKDAAYEVFRRRVSSGGMTVNDFAAHCSIFAAPFGGVGHSGSGAYHGKAGFDTFSHRRTITTSRLPLGLGTLLTPPYSRPLSQLIRGYIAVQRRRAARRLANTRHTTQKENPPS
jgi:coniferyl-aldehyde dehydrogenase